LVAALGVGLLLAPAGTPQAPVERRTPASHPAEAPQGLGDDQIPVIQVQSRLVNVALNVVDAKGAPVAGLTREQFAISEDGKPQKIAIFERESSTPLSIVLAIDASESVLRNERLEKDAARHFVRALLRDQDELDLMEFADNVREIVPFTNQKKRIESGLNELQHGDETALYDAIYLGSERLGQTRNDAGRRRVMVLITDGGDTKKGSRYAQALEEAQRAGAMVYSIIIVPVAADAGRNTGGEHALIQMAEDTGGKYYYVEDPKDLEPAFEHVSDDLRTQYVVGYYAPQPVGGGRADGAFRRIKVSLGDPGLAARYQLRYRSGYYADAR
jgi:Ca-activated chloride channel family protein